MEIDYINMPSSKQPIARSIRAVYGQCGGGSVFLSTGMGITGIVEIYDKQD